MEPVSLISKLLPCKYDIMIIQFYYLLLVYCMYICGLYLYHHFSSDGHTLDDISIMPIEEVVLKPNDVISLPNKRLQREEYWYRELCTVYPYGLNDNVKGVGNVLAELMMDW